MAALRLGMAFASSESVAVLNKIKMPYNVNRLTQERAIALLQHESAMRDSVREIVALREQLADGLRALPIVQRVYPSDANFLTGEGAAGRCRVYLPVRTASDHSQPVARAPAAKVAFASRSAPPRKTVCSLMPLANVPQTATA